jgi:5'-nucleotidase
MRILLTNDDGIFAPGLVAIYKRLTELGEITVVAPASSQSGTGHSITYREPLVCNKVDINGQFTGYSVQGSPADCVKLALAELKPGPVDLVVSGINNGANVGINVYYSGTVAAAMEAVFFKIPAVALSLDVEEKMDFDTAAQYCAALIKKLMPLNNTEVININIPQLSRGKPKGIRIVPQSTQGFDEHYIHTEDEDDKGRAFFQLTGGPHRSEETHTDTISLAQGFITITALHFDMTNYEGNRRLDSIKW